MPAQSTPTLTLDIDIWIDLAETYLSNIDIQSLSQASRYLRRCLVSLLFKEVLFSGFNSLSLKSLSNCFAHLIRFKDRAEQSLLDPAISAAIRYIELRNWLVDLLSSTI
ncbi:hypothetical protein M422DRAFT_242916 [Sphaerobolus stellatus SS14]|nr:hypothetical protein M422DRAFT_242916 [Sphaerobolus stellatus SS14]